MFIDDALKLARQAYRHQDVPVGCVIVKDGRIIAKSYNKKHKRQNAIMHAEIIAINKACKRLHNFRLDECEMYVTKEPCLMCLGAILSARIKTVYYGARDLKYSNLDLDYKFNHKTQFINLNNQECSEILTRFFKEKRQ